MTDQITKSVNNIYKDSNPSFYYELGLKNFLKMELKRKNLFQKLKFPLKMFQNAHLLDLGSGTGQYTIFYNKWGSHCTLVEYDKFSYNLSKKIFSLYSKNKKNKFYNTSLFNFRLKKKFDIIVCNGVLHHTKSYAKGLNLISKKLKKNGYLILGIANSSGFFQRNIQRYLLYKISNSKDEIIKNANILFKNHLLRASKIGGRSIQSIISDTYLNPKIDTPSISQLISLLRKNNLQLYSSFPSLTSFEDLIDIKDWYDLKNINHNYINEFFWLHRSVTNYKYKHINFNKLRDKLTSAFNDLSYKKIRKIKKKKIYNYFNNYNKYISKFTYENLFQKKIHIKLVNETFDLLKKINKIKNPYEIKKYLNACKYLFKGYSGLGMNYFICEKMKS